MGRTRLLACAFASGLIMMRAAAASDVPTVPNPGFEEVDPRTGFARAWIRGAGEGTDGGADLDGDIARSGRRSLRVVNRTRHQAYRYVLVNTDWLQADPERTYILRFHVKGRSVGRCFAGVACEGSGEHRQPLPSGTYDWQEQTFRFTTPPGTGRVSLQFIADDVAEFWIDDVSLEPSPVQLANIPAVARRRPPDSWYPRTPGGVARKLAVVDISRETPDVAALMTALQGLVNRRSARFYLINATNPPGYDEMWLRYLQEKGYTGPEERLEGPEAALRRFRSSFRGAVVWDDALPGSRHAAWMLGSILDALPASAETARRYSLPVVEDLRGRWRRNVDAYRYVWERYRNRLSDGILAWEHPLTSALCSRDVMVQQRAFLFWISAPMDEEVGADPAAERDFVEEVLSQTPANIPVMGWPMYGTKGIEEYTAVRLLSEFGQWVPGSSFTSNGTVHSAVRPPARVFARAHTPTPDANLKPERDRIYLSVNILDSGDAHWYWQFYQRQIWADPARGSVPTGYGMNLTLADALPPVAQWYYEKRAPGDSFFGLLYMNAPVYACRFRKRDRERVWDEYVRLTARCIARMGMEGLELYTGGTGGPSASDELLRRFTRGIPGLRYILAGLGRHTDVRPETAARMLDGVAVFHTLTNFRVWSLDEDLTRRTMESENTWLVGEILANAPRSTPAFMSAMAVSWTYYPSWIVDLKSRLPAHFVMVSPGDMARLYRRHAGSRTRD